jgi:hypothetical protein
MDDTTFLSMAAMLVAVAGVICALVTLVQGVRARRRSR